MALSSAAPFDRIASSTSETGSATTSEPRRPRRSCRQTSLTSAGAPPARSSGCQYRASTPDSRARRRSSSAIPTMAAAGSLRRDGRIVKCLSLHLEPAGGAWQPERTRAHQRRRRDGRQRLARVVLFDRCSPEPRHRTGLQHVSGNRRPVDQRSASRVLVSATRSPPIHADAARICTIP